MSKSIKDQKVSELEYFQKQANEDKFPNMVAAINRLRPVLFNFRQHDFTGVPCARRLTVYPLSKECGWYVYPEIRLSGRWMEHLGFGIGEKIHVIGLGGLMIVVPESYPDHKEFNSVKETELIFGIKGE